MESARVAVCVFGCLLLYRVQAQQEVLIEESSNIESFHAPTGGAVELPCDVTPALPDDRMGLVIWYKQGHDTPIYSLDTREGVTSHWSDPSTLGLRASFRSETRPAVLILTKLRPEDSGQYRCRVDFIKSPTKNTRLNLTVLIPPERLIILNHEGNEITNGVLGPYDEGTEVNLTCVAVGGRPTARVSWWKSHALLANSEARATVSFRLHRSDYGTEITCQAVTDPSITPVSESLSIEINLHPLWVKLQGGKRPLVAGQSTELVCQAVGARPKPTISWWKGGTRLKTVRETLSTDGNVTNSVLTFVPGIDDAGRVLSCRSVQPTLSNTPQEDGFRMEIHHLPVVKLQLGANLDASKVVEDSDVYLDCRVKANPWHTHVYFSHNGAVVKPGPGVLLANQSLVLQHVSRKAAGEYVCTARNSLGEASSEQLVLDVKYAPTCRTSTPIVMRAARGEVLEIECDLDANPKESMSYHWWFNSSAHSKHELTTSPVTQSQNMPGTFLYMVNNSADYGWVQCSGTNAVGRQTKPCLYHILPADKPSSLKACEISNVTYDSLTLNCTPGHDGGIRQAFLLQVFDMTTGLLLRNVTNEDPEFEVSGLIASNALAVSVRAFNKKGSSEPLTLTSNLLKYPQRHTAQVPVKVELTTVLIIVLGAVGVIAAMTAVSAMVFCCKYCNKKDNKNEKNKRQQDETSNIPLTGTKESESVDSLDKNPDIIPLDGKISDSCSNKSSTTDYSSIRPLISKTPTEKYDFPPNCDRFYDHNIDPCNQYIQVRAMDYRVRPTYQANLAPMPNLGPSIQSLGPMSSLHMPNVGANDCHRQQYDKVYEDWLKYKNALPLNTSGLLPAEQLMPPELYSTPPAPSLYSNPNRNPLNLAQMPDLEHRYHLEPRSLVMDSRSCSNSPPVRFNTDNSVYFNKSMLERPTNTLPHTKPTRVNGNSSNPSSETKNSASKATETNSEHVKASQEC
ncbi:nephrin-like [Plodia interpunctella]|uniref:nephrin-like n=1 Tax=Plodia interpunctella TaxID=58824 RepID=UPI002367A26F|nr:nephrin-like [Plodia interpunctella]XP_053620627.1 nephrin-like [Plodia interpunctella]XP_053620628.1 nephrin-like [Plodia interpunctella]XP_053620629.1 nephrin-like [Plodia interpunctella]